MSAVVSFAGEGVSAGSLLIFRVSSFRDYMNGGSSCWVGKRRETNVDSLSKGNVIF